MSEWIAIEGMQIVGTKGEEYPLAYKNIPNKEGEIVREYAVKFKGKWHMITQQEFFQSKLDRPLNDKGRRMYEVRDVLRTASATPIPNKAQAGVVVPDVVLQAETAVVRPATLHFATFSNAQPTKQRMVKNAKKWILTADTAPDGGQVYYKNINHKSGKGALMFGVKGPDGKIRRVSNHYLDTGTHPPKRVKKAPGERRANFRAYIENTGIDKKNFSIGYKKFLKLTPYQRRKDRLDVDQRFVKNGERYDPATMDMRGIDNQNWNTEKRWRYVPGEGMQYAANKGRGAALVRHSKAKKAARIAAGIPLKARPVGSGMGKGHYIEFWKENHAAIKSRVARKMAGAAPSEIQRAVAKEAGKMYREQYHVRNEPEISPGLAAAIVDDERSLIGAKRGRDEQSGRGKRARV